MVVKYIDNLSIGRRLVILVCFSLIVIASTVFIGTTNNQRLANEINLGYEAITRPLAAVANARGHFNAMRTSLYDLAHDFNSKEQNRAFKEHIALCLDEYERNITLYKEILDNYGTNDPYEAEAVAYLYEQLAPLRAQVELIVSVAERTGHGADAVLVLRGDFLFAAEDISADLKVLTEVLEAQTQSANKAASLLNERNNIITVSIVAIAAIILLHLSYVIVNSITKPLKEMTSAAGSLYEGKLDICIEYHSQNHFGVLADGIRLLAQSMKDKLLAEQNALESEIARVRADAAREAVISSIEYASKIQRNLLPPDSAFEEAFSDYSVLWKPRDIVGGDIYWVKSFDEGTVLCVCDCTGHGTPGALLTMLVVSTFEAAINKSNYKDTAEIIWQLEKRLVSVFNVDARTENTEDSTDIKDGCDLAVLYISKDGSVNISAGHTNVFVCDGKEVSQIKGQKIYVGEGRIASKNDIETITIPMNPNNKFYISSDGLFDQMGESRRKFGYKIFKQIILENHNEKQAVVSDKIWEAFESHRGEQIRRDDVELITFKNGIP